MTESSSRPSPSRIAWRILQVAVSAVLLGGIVFVGLTRTDVGRSGIRHRIEVAFNQRYQGHLSIGSLQGTMIDDVIATDVQLFDSTGRRVASVDTIHAEPRWANLLTAELSVHSLTLVRPHLSLFRDSTGAWSAMSAVSRRHPSPPTNQPLDLTVASISIQNGRIATEREGTPPPLVDREWLFDYTRTEATDISAQALVEWSGGENLVEIEAASFRLPGANVAVQTLQGQATQGTTGWSIDQFTMALDTSRIEAHGSLRPSPSGSSIPSFDLQIGQARLNHDELRRLVPRLPLSEIVTAEGRIAGADDRLVLEDFRVAHAQSHATVSGTVLDQPQSTELDLTLSESRFVPEEVREVWPNLPSFQGSGPGHVHANGTVEGTVAWRNRPRARVSLSGILSAQSPVGAVAGTLEVRRERNAPLQYSASLQTDSLDLAPLTGIPDLASRLNGSLDVAGRGTTLDGLRGELDLAVSRSRLGQQRLQSGTAHVSIQNRSVDGSASIQQAQGGTLSLKARIDSLGTQTEYQGSATASNLDLSPPNVGLPSTELNAQLTAQAEGTSWDALVGSAQLTVDSSAVLRGDSTIVLPPHTVALRVMNPSRDERRVEIGGSVASATIDGSSVGPPLWMSTSLWATALQNAVRRELNTTAPSFSIRPLEALLHSTPDSTMSAQREATRATLAELDHTGPIHASGRLRLHRPDIVHAWWSRFPRTADDLTAEATATVSPDTLRASGRLSSNHVQRGTNEVNGLTVTYEMAGSLEGPLAETMSASIDASAQQLDVGAAPLVGATASFKYQYRSGTLNLHVDSTRIVGPIDVASTLSVGTERNEFAVQELSIGLGPTTWTTAGPVSVIAYANAIRVPSFTLEAPHSRLSASQEIHVGGMLSTASSDTLEIRLQNVLVAPLRRALDISYPIAGHLDGTVQMSGGWPTPHVTSNLSVRRLSYDRRVVGDLHLNTEHGPASPDLRIDATVDSETARVDSLVGVSLVPGGPRSVEPTRLSVRGHVRLPAWARSEQTDQPSPLSPEESIDLTVDVDRADLFFFEYIFEQRVASVQGFTTGTIDVGGRLRRPIFDAELELHNGVVELPRFGLTYQVSGPVEVDRRGIHLQQLAVHDDDGEATVNGSILFNEYEYFSFDLSGELDGLTVIDVAEAQDLPFYGDIRASGPATLTGPLPDATLRSDAAVTTPDSELFIPVSPETVEAESGFIVFADSTGQIPNLRQLTRRDNILADRPEGEPTFVEGIDLDLNITAPEGSTVRLVFDPVVGDVVTAVGSGRVQLQRQEGEFYVYGNFNATSGTYLFTAGEVFVRQFAISEGTITWDGSPTNAQLDLNAEYRTRASPSGLPGYRDYHGRIPVTIQLDISGRVATPRVDLSLSLTRDNRSDLVGSETLDAILNRPDQTTEYATSVLLTNTFLLTTESITQGAGTSPNSPENRLTTAGNQLAFNSVSQLVSSQLNRYLGAAFPNLDLNFGVQGENPNDLDLIYGLALRLFNERLIIRGEGVYTGDDPDEQQAQGPQGEFVVEFRLTSSVSAEAFYRRTGDELTRGRTLTSSRGAGLSYQTEFSTWRRLLYRLFGWALPSPSPGDEDDAAPRERAVESAEERNESGRSEADSTGYSEK